MKPGEEGSFWFGPKLLATLLDHKEHSPHRADDDLVFCTGNGGYVNPSKVRQRVLAPAIARANEQLELAGEPR